MQSPIRTLVPGLLLAFSATAVHAQAKAPEATPPVEDPATTQASTPVDLSLNAAAAQAPAPLDLSIHPAAMPAAFAFTRTSNPTPVGNAASLPPAPSGSTLPAAAAPPTNPVIRALQAATTSAEVQNVVRWVTESGDNAGLPFLLIDKVDATVLVFAPDGQLKGAAPALLGMAQGDRLIAPNNAPMSAMPPSVRITPAGRFVSRLAMDSHGKELLVLDYDASISLHAVVKGTPKERRAERLDSATPQDNRISFGCINVPEQFYSTIVSPTFTRTKGIVYVLPETGTASELFGFDAGGAAPAAGPGPTALNASLIVPGVTTPAVATPAMTAPDVR